MTKPYGRICHEAFTAIAAEHNFASDHPDPTVATALISRLAAHPGFYGIVAESDGKIIGSNFVDERGLIIGLGPITIDPSAQNRGVGTALMTHMLERAARATSRQAFVWSKPATIPARSVSMRSSGFRYASIWSTFRERRLGLQSPAAPSARRRPQTLRLPTVFAGMCTVMTAAESCAMRWRGEARSWWSAADESPAMRPR